MAEISDAAVTAGVCAAVAAEYGLDVWVDEIKQGFGAPCFFISAVNSSQGRAGKHIFARSLALCVRYFPPDKVSGQNAGMTDMAEGLYQLLGLIDAGGSLVRGSKMSHRAVDGVLHFFVTYSYRVFIPPGAAAMMETLEASTAVD